MKTIINKMLHRHQSCRTQTQDHTAMNLKRSNLKTHLR